MRPLTYPMTAMLDSMRYRHILTLIAVMCVMLVAVHLTAAFGLRKMLRSTGFENTSRVFLPFLNIESVGLVADKYRARKPITGRLFAWGSVTVFFAVFAPVAALAYKYMSYNCDDLGTIAAFYFLYSAFWLILTVIGAVYTVWLGIAYYRVYRIFAPKYAVGLLILSLAIRPAAAIVFLAICDREPQNLTAEDADQLFWPF